MSQYVATIRTRLNPNTEKKSGARIALIITPITASGAIVTCAAEKL